MNDPFYYIIIGELILMGIFFIFKGFRFFMYIQFLDKNISIHHSFRTSTIFLEDILAIEFKRGGYVLKLKTSKKVFRIGDIYKMNLMEIANEISLLTGIQHYDYPGLRRIKNESRDDKNYSQNNRVL